MDRQLANQIRLTCQSHIENLLETARLLENQEGKHHFAYHFATMALEEIAKVNLLISSLGVKEIRGDDSETWGDKNIDKHVRKIFFALMTLSDGEDVNREAMEFKEAYAKKIHANRMRTQYVDVENGKISDPKNSVSKEETLKFVNFVDALAKAFAATELRVPDGEDLKDIEWFLSATTKLEEHKYIFGAASIKKLNEVGNKKWIRWLRENYEASEKEAEALTLAELERTLNDEDKYDPKWDMRISFYSLSHSIRQKELNKFNSDIHHTKLTAGDKKKKELFVQIFMPKAVIGEKAFTAGHELSKRFLLALNIGSMGVFWWKPASHTTTFIKSLTDLETKRELGMEKIPTARMFEKDRVLDDETLRTVIKVWVILPLDHMVEKQPHFFHYLQGIAFLVKTDVHQPTLRFSAYSSFTHCLITSMRIYGDWNREADFEKNLRKIIEDLAPGFDKWDKHLKLVRVVLQGGVVEELNDEDVCFMKLFCDAYFILKIAPKEHERIFSKKPIKNEC